MSVELQNSPVPPLLNPKNIEPLDLNLNHWFPVAWQKDLNPTKINPVTIWDLDIALFKTKDGQWKALENLCLHKGIPLHHGKVKDDQIMCGNHGWSFDDKGRCQDIPYLEEREQCPDHCVRSFKVAPLYGLIWVFPGDHTLAQTTPLPDMEDYHPDQIGLIQTSFSSRAHFSICLENDMDVFHDHLSKELFGWTSPFLENLERQTHELNAHYVVKPNTKATRFHRLSLAYRYPHIHCFTGDGHQLYLFHQPISAQKTRTFLFFFKGGEQKSLLDMPLKRFFVQRSLKKRLQKAINHHKTFIEREQKAVNHKSPTPRPEINPVIKALRREIEDQHLLISA